MNASLYEGMAALLQAECCEVRVRQRVICRKPRSEGSVEALERQVPWMDSGSSGTFRVQQPCPLVQLAGLAEGMVRSRFMQARCGFGVAQPQRGETM